MMGKDFNSKHWREIMIENTSKKKKRKNNSFDIVGAKNWDGAKLSSAHNDYIKLDRIYKTMDFDTDIPSSITVTPDITSDIECVKYQSDYERICGDVIKKFGFSFIYSGRKIVFKHHGLPVTDAALAENILRKILLFFLEEIGEM